MLKSFFHTGFVVRNIEESAQFYADVLGIRMAGRMEFQDEFTEQVPGFPSAHIKGGFVDTGEGHQLELIQYLSPPAGQAALTATTWEHPTWPSSWRTSTVSTPRLPQRTWTTPAHRRH